MANKTAHLVRQLRHRVVSGRFEITVRVIRMCGTSTAIGTATAIIRMCVVTPYLVINRLRRAAVLARIQFFFVGIADKIPISLLLILLAIFIAKTVHLVGSKSDLVPG